MIEKQELYCHNCQNYVQFDIDTALNGQHVLDCPNCKHKHYRYVLNGKITNDRWNSANGNIFTYNVSSTATYSAISTYDTYATTTSDFTSTGNYIMYQSWMNTTVRT